MPENNQQTIPTFASLEEKINFFDTNDLGDYLDQMPEVHFDVNLQRRIFLIAIDEGIIHRLEEIAKHEEIPAEALVNRWLEERISSYHQHAH